MADILPPLVFSQIIQIVPKRILSKNYEKFYLSVSHDELRREPVSVHIHTKLVILAWYMYVSLTLKWLTKIGQYIFSNILLCRILSAYTCGTQYSNVYLSNLYLSNVYLSNVMFIYQM